jgi:speckle-type POZ protein
MSECARESKPFEFTWKITNYRRQKLRNEPGHGITSQVFPGDCKGDLKFTLEFYPQGDVQSGDTEVTNEEKWTSLYLEAESIKTYDTSHHVELSILDADGETFDSGNFHKKIPFKDWGYSKFIRLADVENPANNLLQNDTLTICCRVVETKSETEGKCNCQRKEPETTQARLVRDFATLLDDKFADFVFNVENVKTCAHRAILAARSPVFAAMFQHEMQENKTNETEVTDTTPAAFRARGWRLGKRSVFG